jgi:hypothetical protein
VPQYAQTNLGTARTQLRIRLNDLNGIRWSDFELNAYLVEALRNWQALTGFYRDRGTLTTVPFSGPTTGFYDLAQTGILQPGLFDYNVTDVQLYQVICAHLLEPPVLPYAGTDQFSQQQILNALQARRDQFLLDTGSVVTRFNLLGGSQPISRINIPNGIIDVRRIDWYAAFVFSTIWRISEASATQYLNSWQTPTAVPTGFSVAVTQPSSVQFIPPSNVSNPAIGLLAVSTGPTLSLPTPGAGIPLGIPDDFSYGVKFGAIADLLRADGQDRDVARATYAESRYQEAVQAARLNPSVLQGIFGSSMLLPGAMNAEDGYNANWQNQVPGPPSRLALAGRNMLVTIPSSDQAYSVTLDLIRNMIVPANDSDFLQVGNEEVDAIIGMGQHLASFNMGGDEFQQTLPLYQNFGRLAILRNNRMNANTALRKMLEQSGQNQERQVPRLVPSPQPTNLQEQSV